MNGYQLTAVIFQSIAAFAWPIALIVIAAMFRGKFTEILPNLRGKYKDVEFWFERVEAEAESLPAPAQQQLPAPDTLERFDRFNEVVKISPQAAMLELRTLLDERLRAVADSMGLEKSGRPVSMLGAIKGLQANGVIDGETATLLRDLRVMGNTAAHTTETFRLSDALRYRSLVERVLRVLPAIPEE